MSGQRAVVDDERAGDVDERGVQVAGRPVTEEHVQDGGGGDVLAVRAPAVDLGGQPVPRPVEELVAEELAVEVQIGWRAIGSLAGVLGETAATVTPDESVLLPGL